METEVKDILKEFLSRFNTFKYFVNINEKEYLELIEVSKKYNSSLETLKYE